MGGVIGFAGLSHLGLVSSIAAASRGFRVIAFDANEALTAGVRGGQLPVHEPGLVGLHQAASDRLRVTSSREELRACDVVVLSIDIPTDDANQSDLSALDKLVDSVLGNLADNTVLVILSQVCPGYTRKLANRRADELTARNIQLYYQVETLIFGRAVERALQPERFIVGCKTPGQALPDGYRQFLEAFDCPILPMRYESAELAKIAINIFLTSTVSATNTLAGICEAIGADWAEIAPSLRLDKRIGPHAYLTPGLGLAGGNLERDLATVRNLAAEHGAEAGIVNAFQLNSQYRRDWALRTLHDNLSAIRPPPVIAVWGLAYKENTRSTKNSPSVALIEMLCGFTVRAFDPQVSLTSTGNAAIQDAASPVDACRGADALVIMTAWPEFQQIDLGEVIAAMNGRLLIDPHGCLADRGAERLGFSYFRLGFTPCERNAA